MRIPAYLPAGRCETALLAGTRPSRVVFQPVLVGQQYLTDPQRSVGNIHAVWSYAQELVEAADERVLSRVVTRYERLDLLCLDELGYIQIDARGAELHFQIISEKKAQVFCVGEQLPFSEWGSVFLDPRLVSAIVDRISFNASILESALTPTDCAPLRPPRDGNDQAEHYRETLKGR
jgi:hypothetical protein